VGWSARAVKHPSAANWLRLPKELGGEQDTSGDDDHAAESDRDVAA
jgi:hypothetical protein